MLKCERSKRFYINKTLEWHSRGQRFEPAYLHQIDKVA